MRTCRGSDVISDDPRYHKLKPGTVFTWGRGGSDPGPIAMKTNKGHVYLSNGGIFARSDHGEKVTVYLDACVCLNGHAE